MSVFWNSFKYGTSKGFKCVYDNNNKIIEKYLFN